MQRFLINVMLNSIYLDATFDLTDTKGTPIPAKMKIVLSPILKSDDYIKKFMEEVEDDLSRLPKHDAVANTVSTLGQVLKFTKTIMDQVSKVRRRHQCLYILTSKSADRGGQAHPILNASWSVASSIYQVHSPSK